MTQALATAAAAAVLVSLWMLGRPRPRLMVPDDGRLVAALNRERIERLHEAVAGSERPAQDTGDSSDADPGSLDVMPAPWARAPGLPMPPRERRRLLNRLAAAARGESQERVNAMSECLHWGDRAVLPLLRRGRLDPDPRVAALAAEGLSRFRGRPGPPGSSRKPLVPVQPARLPRNVSRTL
jgi:hypothetical protein